MASLGSALRTEQRHRPVVSVLLAVAAIVLLMTAAGAVGADRLPGPVGHALSHLFVAGPLAWLLTSMLRSWPPSRATAPGPLGRRLAVGGLAGVLAGQLLEVGGARVDEPGSTTLEAFAHTAGMIVTNLSFVALIVAVVLGLTAAARDRAVPPWVAAVAVVVVVAAVALMAIGEPGT